MNNSKLYYQCDVPFPYHQAVDSRASEVPEMPDMIQYIIELYDGGGTNMANRLPRLKGSLEHTSSTKQVYQCL